MADTTREMLFASAKAASPAAARTDDSSVGLTSSPNDAHRSFCDLFEEEDVPGQAPPAAAGPNQDEVARDDATSATAAAAGLTSTKKSSANETGGHTEKRTLGAGAANSFFEEAAASVRRALVGRNAPFRTPYGMKPLVYSDWTATGRAVDSIEVCT